jgi:hypothetical protein
MSNSTFKELSQWHDKIDKRFASLDVTRNRSRGKPFFVLEHGLDEIDLQDIDYLVKSHGNLRLSFENIELPLIVFATELGFQYENARHKGLDEESNFWPMFRKKIPGWDTPKNQSFFRHVFSEYLTGRYENVFLPDGAWAERFKNISWPVYQAILCKDARQDLIKVMKRLNSFQGLLNVASPQELGGLLGGEIRNLVQNENESLRLDQFIDEHQHRLLGEIAYSIVKPENSIQVDFLSDYAIQRIVEDLRALDADSNRDLEHIREQISRTIIRRGKARGNSAKSRDDYQANLAGRLSGELKIEAELMDSCWQVKLSIPRLGMLDPKVDNFREILHKAHVVKNQTMGNVPPRTLLFRSIAIPINAWPDSPNEGIFEDPSFPTVVTQAIRGDWKMFLHNDLLFRVDGDRAQIQRHYEIQFEETYLYISKNELNDFENEIFRPTMTSFGPMLFAYVFQINENNYPEAESTLKSLDLIFQPKSEIVPIGDLPYFYEKDLNCKYTIDQIATFKVETIEKFLQVEIENVETGEIEILTLGREQYLQIATKSAGSFLIRAETVESLVPETIAVLHVDFFTADDLLVMCGEYVQMLCSVSDPSIQQLASSEIEVCFVGSYDLKIDLTIEALDASGETYPAMLLENTKLPLSHTYVQNAVTELVEQLGDVFFEDVSSLVFRIQSGGIPIFVHEFVSSTKAIRWQKVPGDSDRIRLIAPGIKPESFRILGSNITNPFAFQQFDSALAIRIGIPIQDFIALIPSRQVDIWPPVVVNQTGGSEVIINRELKQAILTMTDISNLKDKNLIESAISDLTRDQFSNAVLFFQLMNTEIGRLPSANGSEPLRHLSNLLSARMSAALISQDWLSIENELAEAQKTGEGKALGELINKLPDYVGALIDSEPEKFGWFRTAGLWNTKEQKRISLLRPDARAVSLSGKFFASDPHSSPLPDEFLNFSERRVRTIDLGLVFAISPLVIDEKMVSTPIRQAAWDAFWNNRHAIALYCRINHIQNLEMGVEWAWK